MYILEEYKKIVKKYSFNNQDNSSSVIDVIRTSLVSFMAQHNNVAIYCYGEHTQMLMADFIFELKGVHYIIENGIEKENKSGYIIIKDEEIEQNNIDGVIISSYKYMNPICKKLKQEHPNVDVLNIYDEMERKDIKIRCEYYRQAHPFHHYRRINELQNQISESTSADLDEKFHELISEYVQIKDFRSAIIKAEEWNNISDDAETELVEDLRKLFDDYLNQVKTVSSKHVLMLCLDGLRRSDFSIRTMPKTYKAVSEKAMVCSNAYSYSTSTYESLMPVYGENTDQRMKYYESTTVNSERCSFIKQAKRQNRIIHFYTDTAEYIEDDSINRAGKFQTVSEKLWEFVLDASNETLGLYYVHIGYESHFAFVNPYTKGKMISEGTGILFDFLPQKGGKLRTDYVLQHSDAIRYLDDILSPILERLSCNTVLYADHGNLVLEQGTEIGDIDPQSLTCHEDLIRIPFALISRKQNKNSYDKLFSLLDFNKVLESLLSEKEYQIKARKWIKIGRSEIYNPDLVFLYKNMNEEHRLLAFEGFIFDTGEKLVVYSDGLSELYSAMSDEIIADERHKYELINIISSEITVCERIVA